MYGCSLAKLCITQKIGHIRIDGEVPPSFRVSLIRKFSEQISCRVAVVSVTACALGLDLSAAHFAVFAEMPPDVSWLLQAEDRLHRQGQKSSVTILILVAAWAQNSNTKTETVRVKAVKESVAYDEMAWGRMVAALRHTRAITDNPLINPSLSAPLRAPAFWKNKKEDLSENQGELSSEEKERDTTWDENQDRLRKRTSSGFLLAESLSEEQGYASVLTCSNSSVSSSPPSPVSSLNSPAHSPLSPPSSPPSPPSSPSSPSSPSLSPENPYSQINQSNLRFYVCRYTRRVHLFTTLLFSLPNMNPDTTSPPSSFPNYPLGINLHLNSVPPTPTKKEEQQKKKDEENCLPSQCAIPVIPPSLVSFLQTFRDQFSGLGGHQQRLLLGQYLSLPLSKNLDSAIKEGVLERTKRLSKKRFKQYADLDFQVPANAKAVDVVVFYRHPRTAIKLTCFVVPEGGEEEGGKGGTLLCLGCGNPMKMILRDPILQQLVSLALSPNVEVPSVESLPGLQSKATDLVSLAETIALQNDETENADVSVGGDGEIEENPAKRLKQKSSSAPGFLQSQSQSQSLSVSPSKSQSLPIAPHSPFSSSTSSSLTPSSSPSQSSYSPSLSSTPSPNQRKRKRRSIPVRKRLTKKVVSVNGRLTAWISHKDHQLFCGGSCRSVFFQTRSGSALRRRVHLAEMYVCGMCGLVCGELLETLRGMESVEDRKEEVLRMAPRFAELPKQLDRLVEHPLAGRLYHADHVTPVWKGGGECGLENMQTLCVPCHLAKTKLETRERAELRREQKKGKKGKEEVEEGEEEEEEEDSSMDEDYFE